MQRSGRDDSAAMKNDVVRRTHMQTAAALFVERTQTTPSMCTASTHSKSISHSRALRSSESAVLTSS
jgi:hypothetical protein